MAVVMAIGCPGGLLGSWLWVCVGWWDNQKVDTLHSHVGNVVVAVALCVMALGCRELGCGTPLWKAVAMARAGRLWLPRSAVKERAGLCCG